LEEALEGLDTHGGGPQNPHSIAAAECLWRLYRRCGDNQQAAMLLLRLGGRHPSTSSPSPLTNAIQSQHSQGDSSPEQQPQQSRRNPQQQQWSTSEQDDDDSYS